MPNKPSKPHDEFFKATFGRREIALDYLQHMLPAGLHQVLDLSKLERVNGSFVPPALKEYFSDMVYQCPLKDAKQVGSVSPVFLFEHKSKYTSRPHLQLLRYLLDAWDEQLQNKKKLTPIIPIVVYHGVKKWKMRAFSSYFGNNLPPSLMPFLPSFDYIFTHINELSDAQILALGDGPLINTFLMFKYIHNPDFILQNASLIFVNLTAPNSQQDLIMLMLAYLFKNSELAEEKVQTFIQTLPETLNQPAMSTYEMIQNKGIQIGMEKERGIYEEILAKERQRAEEEHQRAEEERQRAEEERQRAEEERRRVDNTIFYFSRELNMLPLDISLIVNKEVAYIDALLASGGEEKNTSATETKIQ
jgi:predicted transposase/invertase (TIGR01784 family)